MKIKVIKRKNRKGDRYNISLEHYQGYTKNEECIDVKLYDIENIELNHTEITPQ